MFCPLFFSSAHRVQMLLSGFIQSISKMIPYPKNTATLAYYSGHIMNFDHHIFLIKLNCQIIYLNFDTSYKRSYEVVFCIQEVVPGLVNTLELSKA